MPVSAWLRAIARDLSLVFLALLLVASGGQRATRAELRAAADCFALDDLAPHERARAEALYTIACDLKPMSSGYVRFQFDAARPDLTDIETTRRLLSRFRCSDRFYADVLVFAAVYDGKRQAEGVVFNRRALERTIRAHAAYFAPFGVTPNAHPMDALKTVEHAERALRWRGYGYLFGYPDAAVDFFVAAGESQEATGKFVARDFVHIPSYARETGAFTWAVPKGHQETDEERRLRAEAMAVLEDYRARRARLIGDGEPGVVALLRELTQRPAAKAAAKP